MTNTSLFLLILFFVSCHVSAQDSRRIAEIDSLNQLALEQTKDNPDRAIQAARSAISRATSISYQKGIGDGMNRIGSAFEAIALYDSAMKYHRISLEIRESIGDQYGAIGAFQNLGNCQAGLENFGEAKWHIRKSLSMLDSTDSSDRAVVLRSNGWNNLGLIYLSTSGNDPLLLDSAERYFQKSLALKKTIGDTIEMISVLLNLGSLFYEEFRSDEALTQFQTAHTLAKNIGNTVQITMCLNNLGLCYLDLGDEPRAENLFRTALALSDSLNLLEGRSNALLNLSLVMDNLGDKDSAISLMYDHLDAEKTFRDQDKQFSLLRQYNIFRLQEEEKEQQLIQAKADQAVAERNVLLIGIVGAGLTMLLITLFLRNRIRLQRTEAAREQEQIRARHVEILKKQEVEAFQSLMEVQETERKRIAKDLHDQLGNSLITAKLNVDAIRLKQGDLPDGVLPPLQTTEDFLSKALEQVRLISHEMNTGLMARFGLTRILGDLAKGIETAGFMQVKLEVDPMADQVGRRTAIMIFRFTQELINNAVKHAEAAHLDIQVITGVEDITLIVIDDGKGFTPNGHSSDGMGLNNLATKVEDAGGELQIDSSPGNGATISISLPRRHEE